MRTSGKQPLIYVHSERLGLRLPQLRAPTSGAHKLQSFNQPAFGRRHFICQRVRRKDKLFEFSY